MHDKSYKTMDTNDEKIKLQERLKLLNSELREVRNRLDEIEFEKRYSTVKSYIGKCYINTENDKLVECLYFYGVDLKNCQSKSIYLRYFKETKSWMEISESDGYENRDDFIDYWVEITQSDFLEQYNAVLNILGAKIPPNIFNV